MSLKIAATLMISSLMSPLAGYARAVSLDDSVSLDLFLLAGQSNMAGRGKVGSSDVKVNDQIWNLNEDLDWVPAVDPLHFEAPNRDGVGPGRSFAKAITKGDNSLMVGLIPTAVSGTSITEWNRSGKLYQDAIERAKAAKSHGKLRAILWHQGENDADNEERANQYATNLEKLVKNFRADLGEPNLPFIVGEIGEFLKTSRFPYVSLVNQSLHEVAGRLPNMACVSTVGLESTGDNIHFSTNAQHRLGKAYAKAYLDLVR